MGSYLATQGFSRSGAGQALLRKVCGDQLQQLCVSSYVRHCRNRDWWPGRRQPGCVLVQRYSQLTNTPDRCRSAKLPTRATARSDVATDIEQVIMHMRLGIRRNAVIEPQVKSSTELAAYDPDHNSLCYPCKMS